MVFIPRWERYKDKKPTGLVEVDWNNPLTDSLHNAVVVDKDIVSNESLSSVFGNSISYSASTFGEGVVTGNGLKYKLLQYPFNDSSNNRQATLIAITTLTGAIQQYSGVISTDPGNGFGIRTWATANRIEASIRGTITLLDAPALDTYFLVCQSDSLYANTIRGGVARLYDSTINMSSGSSSAGEFSFNNDLYIGGDYRYETSRYTDQIFHSGYLFHRLLSDDEISTLYEAPYQILKPRQSFFVFGAADISANLTGQSITASAGTVATKTLVDVATLLQPTADIPLATQGLSDVAVDLTGQSISFQAGTLATTISADRTLTGELGTISTGAIAESVSADRAVTGEVATLVQGTVTESVSADRSLTGQSVAVNSGFISAGSDVNRVLTGSAISFSAGALSESISATRSLTGEQVSANAGATATTASHAITGQGISSSTGFISAGADVVRALTGLMSTISLGSAVTTIDTTANGEAVTTQAGTLSAIAGIARSLSGTSLALSHGTLTQTVANALTSVLVTTASGTVEVLDSSVTKALTGASFTTQSGLISPAISTGLTGHAIAITEGALVSALSSLLNGESITLTEGDLSVVVSKTISGESLVSADGTVVLQINDVAIDLTGQALTVSQGRILIDGTRDIRLLQIIAIDSTLNTLATGHDLTITAINNNLNVVTK